MVSVWAVIAVERGFSLAGERYGRLPNEIKLDQMREMSWTKAPGGFDTERSLSVVRISEETLWV